LCCQKRGTQLALRDEPDQLDVTLASLDNPEPMRPSHQIATTSRIGLSTERGPFALLQTDLAAGCKDRLLYCGGFEVLAPSRPGTFRKPAHACSGCRLVLATRTDSSASLVASVKIRSADERV
jgi:hypothetical protein